MQNFGGNIAQKSLDTWKLNPIFLRHGCRVKAQLKWGKHTCLIMRMEHPRAYNYEDETPKIR